MLNDFLLKLFDNLLFNVEMRYLKLLIIRHRMFYIRTVTIFDLVFF